MRRFGALTFLGVVLASCGTSTRDAAGTGGASGSGGAGVGPGDGGADASFQFECPAGPGLLPPAMPACPTVDPQSFGDCPATLGVGFDGSACVEVAGCAAPSGLLFATGAACAVGCAAAGRCDDSKGAGPPKAFADWHCDDVEVHAKLFDAALRATLCAIAPAMRCDAHSDGSPRCQLAAADGTSLSEAQVDQLCAMSLLPQVTGLSCMVYM